MCSAWCQEGEDYRKVSEAQLLTERPALGRAPACSVRVSAQTMESKISTSAAPIADSTDTRGGDLIEAGYGNNIKLNEAQPLNCLPSSVRNFATSGGTTLIQGVNSSGAVFQNCNIVDAKRFYDRGSEFLKCDSDVAWEDFVNVQGANVSDASLSLSSKFIKDEKESSGIMDAPNFDPTSEIPALDTCCDSDTKQEMQGSPNFLIDLNQSDQQQQQQLVPMRTESSCGLQVKPFSFDASRHQQLPIYKNEVPRWQTSPAEPQFWCQSAGVTEDTFTHSGFEGIHSQALVQRNPSPFSSFPG